ncbi:hypothetical protein [Sodalis sp.]
MSIAVSANRVAQTELDLVNRVHRSTESVESRLGWRQLVWVTG